MPVNIPNYDALLQMMPLINLGQERRIPITEQAKQRESAEYVRSGLSEFDPATLSVRQFTKTFDPSLLGALGEKSSHLENMKALYQAWSEKVGLFRDLSKAKKDQYIEMMADYMGAPGLLGLRNLYLKRLKGEIDTPGKTFTKKLDAPFVRITEAPIGHPDANRGFMNWPEESGGKLTRDVNVVRDESYDWTQSNIHHEVGHAAADPESLLEALRASRNAPWQIKPTVEEVQKRVSNKIGSSSFTEADRKILERYLKDPKNPSWTPLRSYEGPGNPEPELAEFMRSFYDPLLHRRNISTGMSLVDKPSYWRAWADEPDIMLALHKRLDMPVPKVIRRQHKLGEFALTPEEEARIKSNLEAFWKKVEAEAERHKRLTLGGPPPSQP